MKVTTRTIIIELEEGERELLHNLACTARDVIEQHNRRESPCWRESLARACAGNQDIAKLERFAERVIEVTK